MAKTMKAAVVRAFGTPLTLEEVPIPTPRSGEVLIKVVASGVCHTDFHSLLAMPCPDDPLLARCLAAAAFSVLLVVGNVDARAAEESSIPNWGKEFFLERCASCHGTDGRGAGPAATALKTGPADLTQISRAHGGEFPFLWVV